MFYKKGALKNFLQKLHENICTGVFLNKVSGLLQHRYFPDNFAKILKTLFLWTPCSGSYFFQMSLNLKRRTNILQMN